MGLRVLHLIVQYHPPSLEINKTRHVLEKMKLIIKVATDIIQHGKGAAAMVANLLCTHCYSCQVKCVHAFYFIDSN